ncbi:MAG: hypothetical protein IJZ77_02000 [Bacilli bacterium]|nr:hypothetical protein [Bacilli bacterium]
MKKYTLISAGISVALFATALTVSLVTNSSTNKRVEEGLADLTNQIESLKSETSQKLTGLETQLSETKAALDAAKNDTSSKFEKLEGDVNADLEALKAADAANLSKLESAVDAVESALETAKTELKANTESSIKTVEDRIALAEKTLEDVNTALDTRVVALESTTAANAEALTSLTADLAELSAQIGGAAGSGAESLSDWIEKVTGEAAVNTKANAVSNLNKYYGQLVAEFEGTVVAGQYGLNHYGYAFKNGEVAGVLESLRTNYYQGLVKISLAVDGEKGNLASTITGANDTLNGIVEVYRVKLLTLDLPRQFQDYKDSLLDNEDNKVLGIPEMGVANANEYIGTINKVTLEKKEYEKETTSEGLNAVLEAKFLKMDIPYYKALLDYTKNQAVLTVDGYDAGNEELSNIKMKVTVDGEEVEKTFIEVRTDNIRAVTYGVDAEKVSNLDKATSRKEVRSMFAEQEELVKIELQLVINQDKEIKAEQAYAAEWFDDKFVTKSWRTGEQYLTDAELKAAKEAYAAVVKEFDWTVSNGLSSKELANLYREKVGEEIIGYEDEAKTKPIKVDVLSKECQVQRLADAMAEFEAIYELEHKKDTAKEDFDDKKVELEDYLDELLAKGYITSSEHKALGRMTAVIEIADVTDMATIEEIKAEEARVYNLLDSVKNMADGESTETQYTNKVNNMYSDLSDYADEFNSTELANIKDEYAALDRASKYVDSIFATTSQIDTMTDADVLGKVIGLDAKSIANQTKEYVVAANDVTNKYKVVLAVREYTTMAALKVNVDLAVLSDAVNNDYDYEFRRTGDFMKVPTDMTAEEVMAEAGTPKYDYNEKGEIIGFSFNEKVADGFVGRVNSIYNEAHDLALAFTNTNEKATGSLVDIDTIEALANNYAEKGGLDATAAGKYVKAIEALGTPDSLYTEIKEAVANGGTHTSVLKQYSAAVDKLLADAKEHDKALELAFGNNAKNVKKWDAEFVALHALRGETHVNLNTEAKTYKHNVEASKQPFEEVAIVVAADGTVIFAGTTDGKLPNPANPFYADAEFKLANGAKGSIFVLGDNYLGTNKDKDGKVITTGKDEYTVVIPEGATIITGSAVQMDLLANKIYGKSVDFGTVKDGSLNAKVVVNDLFDTLTTSMWAQFDAEGEKLIADTKKAQNACTTEAAVKAAQATFEADYKNLFAKYDDLYKQLDANVLETNVQNAVLDLEEAVRQSLVDYQENALLIQGVRSDYKAKIRACVYSYEVAGVYEKFEKALRRAERGEVALIDSENVVINQAAEDGQVAIFTSDATTVTPYVELGSNGIASDGYTLGIDKNGRIIYATFGATGGYGGPADGFYHDGSYQLVAGKQCGVFDVFPTFAGWPAQTPEGKPAWNEYKYAVPQGGYIITGSKEAMENLICDITSRIDIDSFVGQGNSLFENSTPDGSLNDVVVTVTINGDKVEVKTTHK